MHPAALRTLIQSICALREVMRRDRACRQNVPYLACLFVDGLLVGPHGVRRFSAADQGLPPHSSGPVFTLNCVKQEVSVRCLGRRDEAPYIPRRYAGAGKLTFEEFVTLPSDADALRQLFGLDVDEWLKDMTDHAGRRVH